MVMALKVRDEVDVIEHNLRVHHALGIEHFVVTHLGSIDSSHAVLKRWEKAGLMTIFERSGVYLEESTGWAQEMIRYAIDGLGADWVIHCDSDEFVLPVEGTIATALAAIEPEAGAVVMPRSNFVAVPGPEPFLQRLVVRERRSTLGPKLAHRGLAEVVMVENAGHLVTTERDLEVQFRSIERAALKPSAEASPFSPPPPELSWSAQVPLRMHHYPVRSLDGFTRRLEIEVNDKAENDPRIDRLKARLDRGEAQKIYAEQLASPDQISEGLAAGRLVRDERVLDLATRAPDPIESGVGAGSLPIVPGTDRAELLAEQQSDALTAVGRVVLLATVRHKRTAALLKRARRRNSRLQARLATEPNE